LININETAWRQNLAQGEQLTQKSDYLVGAFEYADQNWPWKKVKKRATHLKFFPEFALLMQKVEEALLHFANTPKEIMSLMGRYCESLGAIAA
jgi:hypothetical protein